MSFFVKSKGVNGFSKSTPGKQKKRKLDKISKNNDEISSSEDEGYTREDVPEASSEDENETVQEKRLRLAKVYLEEIEREERNRLDDEEFNKGVLTQRLKEDHLKQIGKYESKIASKYKAIDESSVKVLKCREQKNSVTCLCLSADNKWAFSGSKDGVVVKWCLNQFRKIGLIPFIKNNTQQNLGHSSCIHSIAISSDNKFLVVGDSSGMIQIWDPVTLGHINTLKGHKKPVSGLVFKSHSHTLYSASQDHSVRVWSLDEMAFVETLFGHQDAVTAIDALNAEKPVSAGGRDGTLRLWKVAEESQLIFNAQPGHIDAIKLINDQYFVSGGDDGQLSVWSCLKKKPISSVKAAHGCDPNNSEPLWISAVSALPHTDLIASGSRDGCIKLWQLEDKFKRITKLLEVPVTGFVNSLAFTADGKFLIAGLGKDHRLGRWATVKSAKNCVLVIPLVQESSQ